MTSQAWQHTGLNRHLIVICRSYLGVPSHHLSLSIGLSTGLTPTSWWCIWVSPLFNKQPTCRKELLVLSFIVCFNWTGYPHQPLAETDWISFTCGEGEMNTSGTECGEEEEGSISSFFDAGTLCQDKERLGTLWAHWSPWMNYPGSQERKTEKWAGEEVGESQGSQ